LSRYSYQAFASLFVLGSASYHPNQNNTRRSARYPEREKERNERTDRDRERIHPRDREMGFNDEDLMHDRHYGGGVGGGGMRDEFAMHRDERRAIDRDPRNRDPRVDRSERNHLELGSNSRHLIHNNSYDDGVDLIREKDKERFAHRREREADYSPHRQSRRVLNANAM
jgi:hypothetical protein